jgi:hypothetical protein
VVKARTDIGGEIISPDNGPRYKCCGADRGDRRGGACHAQPVACDKKRGKQDDAKGNTGEIRIPKWARLTDHIATLRNLI